MPRASLLLSFLIVTTVATLPVNVTRLKQQITQLATHNDLSPPAVQRILYTPSDVSARTYLKSLFSAANLSIHEDPLGNIFSTWHGAESGPGVLTGSHFDAIPNSGMYDGTLGILSGLEAILVLKETGFVPRRSITVLAFTSEEPTRFGLSCIGSRLLASAIKPDRLAQLKDSSDIPFETARSAAGYSGDIATVPLSSAAYSAFVELHSEQGPILEDSNTQIGAVTAIAAPAALTVTYTGPGGHAGTTMMSSRKDPSLAAAELSLAVEGAVKRFGGDDTVGTTGFVEITPNAVNSVPTMAKIGIDIRDIDRERRDRVLEIVENAATVIAKRRDVGVEVVFNSRDPPATCDENIVNAVTDTANKLGLTYRKMVSRAYHDALFMAGIIPTGMIFVPCRNGVSHRPDEYVTDRDMENGVNVLAGVLKRLAGDAEGGKENERVDDGKQADEAFGEGVKPSGDGEDIVLHDDAEAPKPLATPSGDGDTDDTKLESQGATETQVVVEAADGEAPKHSEGYAAELSTPSVATNARSTRRSASRETAGSDAQEGSESSQPKESQAIENVSVDSTKDQQRKKQTDTRSDESDTDEGGSRETVQLDETEKSESIAKQSSSGDEKNETKSETLTATKTDPTLTERYPTQKTKRPEEAEAKASKAKKSKKSTAKTTRRKRNSEGSDSENGTTSNASGPEGTGKKGKPEPANEQTDSPDKKEGGALASDFGIEGFDESGNSLAGEKEEL